MVESTLFFGLEKYDQKIDILSVALYACDGAICCQVGRNYPRRFFGTLSQPLQKYHHCLLPSCKTSLDGCWLPDNAEQIELVACEEMALLWCIQKWSPPMLVATLQR